MKALITVEGKTATVQDVPTPTPEEGEILVKVHYVAQNPTDWKAMRSVAPGRTIGCDFAGTVEDPNTSHWRKGQRVAGFVQGTAVNPSRGAFAEYAVVEASLVYAIPEQTSYSDAAAVPLAFATASQALYQRLALPEPSKPAKSPFPVLVNGGTSSVGKYAVQLAKLSGLFVIATGSKRNHSLLESLGADATIDYSDADWPDQVRRLTHDNLTHAFDCIGENGTVEAVARALSPSKPGHVVTILPVPDTVKSTVSRELSSDIRLESTIVYTVFGRPLKYGAFDNCGAETPVDRAHWEKFLALLPELLESGRVKSNRVREVGGIDDILRGFREQSEGKVSAEKLVYKIAA